MLIVVLFSSSSGSSRGYYCGENYLVVGTIIIQPLNLFLYILYYIYCFATTIKLQYNMLLVIIVKSTCAAAVIVYNQFTFTGTHKWNINYKRRKTYSTLTHKASKQRCFIKQYTICAKGELHLRYIRKVMLSDRWAVN